MTRGNTYISSAFHEVLADATEAKGSYVSLYVDMPYYGGPEEGGWWGSDTKLVSYQRFPTIEAAEIASEEVQKLAEELSSDARKAHDRHCAESMDWLDARGLDADYLPEPDGEERYFVVVEDSPGSRESEGSRHYE